MDYSATFGDLFAEVLTERGARQTSPQRGADLHVEMQVTFEESLSGGQRAMTVTRRDHCRVCAGSGRTRASTGPCHLCQGTGAVRSVRGHMIFSRSCGACSGTGHQRPRPCEPCAGTGQETRSETVTARIPPGVADGDRLRVPGKGNVGVGGGPAGDLYVTVKVGPHPVFRRDGDDLHMSVPIAVHEAALGRARGDPDARRRRAPADSARDADRPALSFARARRAFHEKRAARRPDRGSADHVAQAAGRALEGTVAGVRQDQR